MHLLQATVKVVGVKRQWLVLQGGVMILQNRYQRRRMYTRIALGKNRAMDVVGGEAVGSSGNLYFLYPLLLCLQGWQICIGESQTGVLVHYLQQIQGPALWHGVQFLNCRLLCYSS
jgi:hypothetical protein